MFAALYFAGFFAGGAIAFGRGPVRPAFVAAGSRLGASGPEALLAIATLAVIACWALRVWGAAYLQAAVVWNADALDHRLIVAGPFRYVRDPLYLGSLLLAFGFGALAPPLGFAIVVVSNLIFVAMLVREEATLMRARYGAVYDAYCAAVPSLFPRFTAAEVPGSQPVTPSLAEGLRSEILSAGFAVAMVVLAAGGPRALPAFYAVCTAAVVAGSLARRLTGSR